MGRGGKKTQPFVHIKPNPDARNWLWRVRDEPPAITPSQPAACPIPNATARILSRHESQDGMCAIIYRVEVTHTQSRKTETAEVDLNAILDFVSPRELERFENDDFVQLSKAELVAQEANRAEEENGRLSENSRPRAGQVGSTGMGRGRGRGRGWRGGQGRGGASFPSYSMIPVGPALRGSKDTDSMDIHTSQEFQHLPVAQEEGEDEQVTGSMSFHPPGGFQRAAAVQEEDEDGEEDEEEGIAPPAGFHRASTGTEDGDDEDSDEIDLVGSAHKTKALSPNLMKSSFVANSALPTSPLTKKTISEESLGGSRARKKKKIPFKSQVPNGCSNCRKCKRGCTEEWPTCSFCMGKGLECVYPDHVVLKYQQYGSTQKAEPKVTPSVSDSRWRAPLPSSENKRPPSRTTISKRASNASQPGRRITKYDIPEEDKCRNWTGFQNNATHTASSVAMPSFPISQGKVQLPYPSTSYPPLQPQPGNPISDRRYAKPYKYDVEALKRKKLHIPTELQANRYGIAPRPGPVLLQSNPEPNTTWIDNMGFRRSYPSSQPKPSTLSNAAPPGPRYDFLDQVNQMDRISRQRNVIRPARQGPVPIPPKIQWTAQQPYVSPYMATPHEDEKQRMTIGVDDSEKGEARETPETELEDGLEALHPELEGRNEDNREENDEKSSSSGLFVSSPGRQIVSDMQHARLLSSSPPQLNGSDGGHRDKRRKVEAGKRSSKVFVLSDSEDEEDRRDTFSPSPPDAILQTFQTTSKAQTEHGPPTPPAAASAKPNGNAKAKVADPEHLPSQNSADEDEDTYIVEDILSHRRDDVGRMWYQVKWEGYEDPNDMTWENEEGLEGASDVVELYRKRLLKGKKGRKVK